MQAYQLPQSTIYCKEDFSKYNGEGTELRRVQLRSLEMLKVLDQLCRQHNIQYWLIGGTLLGAVRHRGFIPWDDDIDISIKWSDIPKFRKVMLDNLPINFVYQDWTTDPNYFLDSVVKLRDKNSYFPLDVYRNFKEQGILLDIIPMEKFPSKKWKQFVFNINKYPYLRKKNKSLGIKIDRPILSCVLTPIVESIKWLSHLWSAKTTSKCWGFNYIFHLLPWDYCFFEENDIFPLVEAEFEGMSCFVPHNAIAVLNQIYGDDCLEIPDLSKRKTHTSNVQFFD